MRIETILNAAQQAHARNMQIEQAIKGIHEAMRPLRAMNPAAQRSLGIYGVNLEAQLYRASAKTYRQAERFDYELRSRIKLARMQAAAEIDACRARIAELEGLLREAMPMIKNASALAAAVNELAEDLPAAGGAA